MAADDALQGLSSLPVAVLRPPAPSSGQTRSRFAYLYLVRVPLLTAILFVALPVAGLATGARSLLLGFFDVTGIAVWSVATVAFMLALVVMTTSFLVAAYAKDRFDVPTLNVTSPIHRKWYVFSGLL